VHATIRENQYTTGNMTEYCIELRPNVPKGGGNVLNGK
jgi:hypothetical protein